MKQWFETTIASYGEQSARFMKRERDPIANPLGSTLRTELGNLFDALLDSDRSRSELALDRILQLRAIQDFSPAQAVGFVFKLKPILHGWLKKEPKKQRELDDRVDQLALLAFNIYMKWREKVFSVAMSEVKSRASMARKAQADDVILVEDVVSRRLDRRAPSTGENE